MKRIFFLISIVVITIVIAVYAIKIHNKISLIDADYSTAISSMKKELNEPNNKKPKYYYINIWNLKCQPCIKEMPELDSIAGNLSDKIKFVFVTDDDNDAVNKFIEKKKIKMKHFQFINGMNYFISAIYKKVGNAYKVYPTNVIIDSLDNILFFSQGSLTKLDIKNLKLSDTDKKRFTETLKDRVIKKLESLN